MWSGKPFRTFRKSSKCLCCYTLWNFLLLSAVVYGGNLANEAKSACATEYSSVGSSSKAEWKSDAGIDNQVVVSSPPCIDSSNHLVTRICINGSWVPPVPPRCAKASKSHGVCPEGYLFIKKQCVMLAQPPNSRGGRADYLFRFGVGDDSSKELEPYVWLPIKRVQKFGPFEYVDFGSLYGNEVDVQIKDYKQFFSGDCLVLNIKTNETRPEKCEKTYRRLKQYRYQYRSYSCPSSCKAAEPDAYKCYCKSDSGICENYATIGSYFAKSVVQRIAGTEVCRVGGGEPEDFQLSQNFKLVPVLNGTVWQYSEKLPMCSICQTKAVTIRRPHMVLSFDEKKPELLLLLYFAEGVAFDNNVYAVTCFTDASKKLKKKVDISLKFKYQQSGYGRKAKVQHSFQVYKLDLEKYMGQYWCEAWNLDGSKLSSGKVIAYKKKEGNEYSLRILIRNVCKKFNCNPNKFYDNFIDAELKDIFKPFNSELRVMEIYNFDVDKDELDFLLHISTGRNANVVSEYQRCLERLERLSSNRNIEILDFRSSEYCLPATSKFTYHQLSWPSTRIGSSVIPEELCLTEDARPAIRTCLGNFLNGSSWSDISGTCSPHLVSSATKYLHDSLREPITLNLVQNITQMIKSGPDLTISDIYYLAEILNQTSALQDKTPAISCAFDIIEKIVDTNVQILEQSQILLNLTDTVLEVFDSLVSEAKLVEKSVVFQAVRKNFIVHITNPFTTNTSGMAIYGGGGGGGGSLLDVEIVDFRRNLTFDSLDDVENLQVAAFVPESILDQISRNETDVSNIFVVTTIYQNDSLFINDAYKSAGYVISIQIPGYGSYLEYPIPILFRSDKEDADRCAYWDIGVSTSRKKGSWSRLGGSYMGTLYENSSLHLCSFVHLTPFALLIMSDRAEADENGYLSFLDDDSIDKTLNIFTIFGGVLSIIGVAGIFLTAAVFKQWRNMTGTKILLNLSMSVLLEVLCLHLSEIWLLRKSDAGCKAIGMILHYVILSKFCWTLVYAALQYVRFVVVLGPLPNNLVLKCVLVGWVVPLLLVIIVGLSTSQSYRSSSYELCYPRGGLLYFFILLPIGLIILANAVIFCLIMREVTKSETSATLGKRRSSLRVEFYLAVLLFFVLGFPWIFGILADVIPQRAVKLLLFYVFCISATIQGFVLFLFYVVFNRKIRRAWIKYLENVKCTR